MAFVPCDALASSASRSMTLSAPVRSILIATSLELAAGSDNWPLVQLDAAAVAPRAAALHWTMFQLSRASTGFLPERRADAGDRDQMATHGDGAFGGHAVVRVRHADRIDDRHEAAEEQPYGGKPGRASSRHDCQGQARESEIGRASCRERGELVGESNTC